MAKKGQRARRIIHKLEQPQRKAVRKAVRKGTPLKAGTLADLRPGQKKVVRRFIRNRAPDKPTTKTTGKATKGKIPSRPPAGYYDPNLDVQERAAKRGLSDLTLDTAQQRTRGATDVGLQRADLGRQRGEFNEDIGLQRTAAGVTHARSLSDLLTERKQTGEDYTRNLAQLQRNYDQLGSAQAQTGRAAGLAHGGFMAQAAQKRAANQAWERQPIDTGFQRFSAASQLQQQRGEQDYGTQLSDILRAQRRGSAELDRSGGQVELGYQRQGEDLTTQLARAQRENTAYGLDVGAARFAQAAQAGWTPQIPKAQKAGLTRAQIKRQRQKAANRAVRVSQRRAARF